VRHLYPVRTTELSRRRLLQVAVGAAGLSTAMHVFGAAAAGTAPSSGSGLIRNRAPSQFYIFDLHHHVTVPGLEIDKDIALRLAFMDANSIEQCLLMPAFSDAHPNGIADTRVVNNTIAAYRDRDPKRFPVACGIVGPLDGPGGEAEIERCIGALKLKGMVWHSRFQGVALNDPRMINLLKKIDELGILAFVHIFADSKLEAPWRLETLADQFPKVTFVALDAFSGASDQAQSLPYIARKHPNILFDTAAMAPVGHGLRDFIEEVGADRLLFGSDLYSTPAFTIPFPLYEILASDFITDDDCRKILGGNARRLLKLG
jgi:uncharacterized protein